MVCSLQVCDQENGKVRVLFEIQRWQPFNEEYQKPADFVTAKFNRNERLPCACTITFVRSSDCSTENVVAVDRAYLQEDEPKHVEMNVTASSGPIPMPGWGITLMEMLLTGGRSSRKYIRGVNKMRANAVNSILEAIREYRLENGEWPQSPSQLWAWLARPLDYEYQIADARSRAVLTENEVTFRPTATFGESATFEGSAVGLDFNETIKIDSIT